MILFQLFHRLPWSSTTFMSRAFRRNKQTEFRRLIPSSLSSTRWYIRSVSSSSRTLSCSNNSTTSMAVWRYFASSRIKYISFSNFLVQYFVLESMDRDKQSQYKERICLLFLKEIRRSRVKLFKETCVRNITKSF